MALYSDGKDFPVNRADTPEMLYENTFSDTDDDDNRDDDITHQVDEKNPQPIKSANQANKDETEPQFPSLEDADHSLGNAGTSSISNSFQSDLGTVVNPPSPEVILSPTGTVPGFKPGSPTIPGSPAPQSSPATSCTPAVSCSPKPSGSPSILGSPTTLGSSKWMTTTMSHQSTDTLSSGAALQPLADTSEQSTMPDHPVNPEIAVEHFPSEQETTFNRFISNWTLNNEDLKCFPFRKSTNCYSSMHEVPTKQFGKRKKVKNSCKRRGCGCSGSKRKLLNMSPYAMLARMAEKQGYDVPTFLETLEYNTGSSGVLPCMQCYEKYGGMDMPGYGAMHEEQYMEDGKSAMSGRCQSCGGKVLTMASYGVMLRKLKEVIIEKDFIPHDVYPDGNCLFAAVIDQLHIHSDFTFSMHSLRLASVEYIRNNPNVGDGTPIEMFLTDETLDTYLDRMSMDGEWGDHIILSAIANVINMPIFIYGGMSGQNETIVSPTSVPPEDHHVNDLKNIFLGHIGESHYFSLRPKHWKENRYEELVQMGMSEKEAKYPMQYFNFILTQIFRMDTSTTSDQMRNTLSMFDEMVSSMVEEDEIDIEVFGSSECRLNAETIEQDSGTDDISTFFPSAKVEDVTKEGEGIFMFHTPKDTKVVSDDSTAGSFDLIIEPQTYIDLLKLVPASLKLWDGQTETSSNKTAYLKTIDLQNMHRNSSSLFPLDYDLPKKDLKIHQVFAFKCAWPKASEEWSTRLRKSNFPNSHTVEAVVRMGCHAISQKDIIEMADYLGKPESEKNADLVWCYSFACAEKEICRFISQEQKQCYLLFRSTAGMVLSKHVLPIAIFKSIFFYSCENISESIWLSKPGECYFIMLKKLAECLKDGFIPHYFMSEKNLLDFVSPESIIENQKMLSFAKYQPVTSLYFVMDSLKLMSTDVGSFVEEMIQGACNMDPKDEQQTEQIMRAGSKLLGSFIAEGKYQNAMLVFNSLVEQTVLNSDKSLDVLNKQLPDINLGSKWCFALYVDIRQKSSLTTRLCDGMPTIHITELFGPDCTEEIPDTCVPECYSIDRGNLFFISGADEVLELCVSTKVHTKCSKFYLKKYAELAGDAFILPACGLFDEYHLLCGGHLKTSESYIQQMLPRSLLDMYVRLFNQYFTMGSSEEFRELLPAYEKLAKVSDCSRSKRNLYYILKTLGETKKAEAISLERGQSALMILM